jgi:thiol-disulfide isomerase/thioredoxin
MTVKRHILFFVAVAAVLAFYVVVRSMVMSAGSNPPVPPLPAISFYDKSGKSVTLSDLKGKVVLVNLWATWCPPCVAEMPSLDRLQKSLGGKDFAVVALSVDTTSMKTVTDFLQKQHFKNITPYWDKDQQIALKWKYEGLPTSFLLDRQGNPVKRYDGGYEWDEGSVLKEIETQITK